MNQLKQIHAYTIRNGTDQSKYLIVKVLEIPNLAYAHTLFNLIPNPSVFLYNKLIQAHSFHAQHHHCWPLYTQMCRHGCPLNQHSFTFLFAACAHLSSPSKTQILHTHFVKSGFKSDVFALTALVDSYAKLDALNSARQLFDEMPDKDTPIWNSIISGYSRSGNMEEALKLFDLMPSRSVVSWTSMISGYSQNGKYTEALEMFLKMERGKNVKPNEVTIASVLPACANLGALEVGKRLEAYARKNGMFKNNLYVSNAILEMYSRCGNIEMARQVFDEIGSWRNLCSWNSMIMGLAVHGRCNEALTLYVQMQKEGTAPDDVTFVGLLLACTHGGTVIKGQKLFESMEKNFHITPKLEHYGCMVDLLGRAGQIQEAYALIQNMPMRPDSVIWGALLGACSFHGNVEIAEKAAGFLFKLEPWNLGNYVILSNIYALAGCWNGVSELRKVMKRSQIAKTAGYSFIEEGGCVHKFIVEDRSHPRSDDIYALLDGMFAKMGLKKCVIFSQFELDEIQEIFT